MFNPAELIAELEKIPGAVEARVEREIAAVKKEFESTLGDKVKAVIEEMFGSSPDLSGLQAAITKLSGTPTPAVPEAPQSDNSFQVEHA